MKKVSKLEEQLKNIKNGCEENEMQRKVMSNMLSRLKSDAFTTTILNNTK